MQNISALLSRGGTVYFNIPVGRQRIAFDAHRIFPIHTIMQLYEDKEFQLHELLYVDDRDCMNYNANLSNFDIVHSLSLDLGCKILFKLKKVQL